MNGVSRNTARVEVREMVGRMTIRQRQISWLVVICGLSVALLSLFVSILLRLTT